MTEEREVWDFLLTSGFLHALREAHEATTRIVFGRLSRSAGFKERSFGFTSYDVLESQLDRVFGLGEGADGGAPVVRDNLNGSPGWRCGPYRILLRRYDLGAVEDIRWDQASPTKQAVAKQEYAEDPQLALDVGPVAAADTPEPLTLVLAHSASEEPLEMELFLGRPRYNADGGSPWWWRRALTRENLGADPRPRTAEPTLPIWGPAGEGDEADVPVRLRPRTGKTERARSTPRP